MLKNKIKILLYKNIILNDNNLLEIDYLSDFDNFNISLNPTKIIDKSVIYLFLANLKSRLHH